MESDKANSRIHVCSRLRPLIPEDYKLGNVVRSAPERCVHLSLDGQTIKLTKDAYDVKLFRVDHTFDESASQMHVYNLSYKKIVTEAINGYNGTGMVYGQTGSGKSHTIFGNDSDPGLVQLAINDVFAEVRERISKDLVANVFLSFYQLYLEQAYDLLVTQNGTKQECVPLAVREDAIKGAFVENLQYIYVDDESTTMEVLKQGLRNRRVQSTTYNMSSSRSHAIFQMYLDFEESEETNAMSVSSSRNGFDVRKEKVNSQWKIPHQESSSSPTKFNVRRRVLTFVDLAGSERVQTHHKAKSKTQFKESVAINKSISALGNCIQALAAISSAEAAEETTSQFPSRIQNNQRKVAVSHVPFRDCKLTRLLAEPLGGNSKTCIIVNIGPCFYNYEETASTLKFARRAMTIRKKVKKSEIEQLHVQDVLSEEPALSTPFREPSPPRISLGGKKITSLKLARIVIRDIPDERQQVKHRYDNSEEEISGELRLSAKSEDLQLHHQARYETTDQQPLNRSSSSGYFLHIPAGSEFDSYGTLEDTQHMGDSDARNSGGMYPPSVKLNLGDFLKACQAKGYTALSAPGVSVQPNQTVVASTISRSSSYIGEDGDDFLRKIPMDMHGTPMTIETSFTPISGVPSSYISPFPQQEQTPVVWGPTAIQEFPSSSTRPSPDAEQHNAIPNRVTVEDLTNLGSMKKGEDLAVAPTPVRKNHPELNILLPSPHPNLANVPYLSHEDASDAEPLSTSTSFNISTTSDAAGEPTVPDLVLSERKQRRFVWERGSGDVNHTIDITPLVSKYRSRGAAVAAVSSIPTSSPRAGQHMSSSEESKDTGHPPNGAGGMSQHGSASKSVGNRDGSAANIRPGMKVKSYLQYNPLAGSAPSSAATDRSALGIKTAALADWDYSTKTTPSKPTPSGKKKTALSVETGTVLKDETNSMPRSGAPKPTASPSSPPQHIPSKHPAVNSSGPYNFHRLHSTNNVHASSNSSNGNASAALLTPRKKSVNWGDKKIERSNSGSRGKGHLNSGTAESKHSESSIQSPMLAATIQPFSRGGAPSPHGKSPGKRLTSEEIAEKIKAADSAGNSNGKEATPQTALVKLVQDLRDELHRKEEEILSLKNFILHN